MKFIIICLFLSVVLSRKPKSEFGHWLTHEIIVMKTHYDQYMKRWLVYRSFESTPFTTNILFNTTEHLRSGYSENIYSLNDLRMSRYGMRRFGRGNKRFGYRQRRDYENEKSQYMNKWEERSIENNNLLRNLSSIDNSSLIVNDRDKLIFKDYYYGYYNFDWRNEYPISSVDDELVNDCDSSYIFATVCSIEAVETRKNKFVNKLSSQEYIDCENNNNNKCNNNNNDNNKILSVIDYYSGKKICSSNSYKYSGNKTDNKCKVKECENKIEISNFTYFISNKESDIESLVRYFPVITKMNINNLYDKYSSLGEIYDNIEECNDNNNEDDEVNHWVSVVGYGKEIDKEYWIIRNDFGKEWGEKGYLKVAKGKNMCGIGKENYLIYDESIEEYILTIFIVVVVSILILMVCMCYLVCSIFNFFFRCNKCAICRKEPIDFLYNNEFNYDFNYNKKLFYNQSYYYQQKQQKQKQQTNHLFYSKDNDCSYEDIIRSKNYYFKPITNLPLPLSN